MTLAGTVLATMALAAVTFERVAVPAGPVASRARYVVTRDPGTRGLALPEHHAAGWSQRARLLASGATELTVVSDAVRWTVGVPVERPPAARAALQRTEPEAEEVRLLAEELAADGGDRWEVSARIITWVSVNVGHADAPGHDESASSTLSGRRASCVGRSVLAVELLRAAGVPARTIHGAIAPSTDGARAPTLHRFLETWLDGIGWLPSDPGESVHVVDARHIFLATDEAPYDPEAQRGLRVRVAEAAGPPLAARAVRPDQRALVLATRPDAALRLPLRLREVGP